MSHTSGPWKVSQEYHYNAHYIVDISGSDGIPLGYANACKYKPIPGKPFHVYEDLSEIRANGRLMACAPELLQALRVLAYEARGFRIIEDAIGEAHAAIAKAVPA